MYKGDVANEVFDSLLEIAFYEYAREEFEALPPREELDRRYPIPKRELRFAKRKDKELKYQKPLCLVYIKRTAIALIVLAALAFCVAMLDSDTRTAFAERLGIAEKVTVTDKNDLPSPTEAADTNTLDFNNIRIGYIPDRFNIIEEYRDERYLCNSYMTDEGSSAVIEVIATSVGQISTDAVYHSYEQIEINGIPAYKSYHTEYDQGKIIMRTDKLTVIIDAAVSEEELIQIAEGIRLS